MVSRQPVCFIIGQVGHAVTVFDYVSANRFVEGLKLHPLPERMLIGHVVFRTAKQKERLHSGARRHISAST